MSGRCSLRASPAVGQGVRALAATDGLLETELVSLVCLETLRGGGCLIGLRPEPPAELPQLTLEPAGSSVWVHPTGRPAQAPVPPGEVEIGSLLDHGRRRRESEKVWEGGDRRPYKLFKTLSVTKLGPEMVFWTFLSARVEVPCFLFFHISGSSFRPLFPAYRWWELEQR